MSEQMAHIQWFPGHMAKTRRMMQEQLKLVDIVIEIRDARIPYASANPEIKRIIGAKPRVILLAKSDLADPAITKAWLNAYAQEGTPALAIDCKTGTGFPALMGVVEKALTLLLATRAAKGMQGLAIRAMVVGVPNVGKSSFINRIAGGKRAKVEDRPGVTRAKQWVKAGDGLELLDMPGVLWPKFEDPLVGENLALSGAVKDDIMDTELLAARLMLRLAQAYPKLLEQRYQFPHEDLAGKQGYELLELFGKKRGMLLKGGVVNTERAATALLDEFRSGKIGRISLESPAVLEKE